MSQFREWIFHHTENILLQKKVYIEYLVIVNLVHWHIYTRYLKINSDSYPSQNIVWEIVNFLELQWILSGL